MAERILMSMISKDGRHAITVTDVPELRERRLTVDGPDVAMGRFNLNVDLETARYVGRALIKGDAVAPFERDDYEADLLRYGDEFEQLLKEGHSLDHPLVKRARRRIQMVRLMLERMDHGV